MTVPVMWRGTTTTGEEWLLVWRDDVFVLRHGLDQVDIPASDAGRIVVTRRWWRTRVTVTGLSESLGVLDGLTGDEGRRLEEAVQEALSEALVAWIHTVTTLVATARRDLRWITKEEVAALLATRPLTADRRPPGIQSHHVTGPAPTSEEDVRRWVRTVNDEVAADVLRSQRQFFDTIESSPLTDEQARAVVTYDNRVNVIAAAGSGKTQGIGKATGRKPTVAPWLTDGSESQVLSEIVAELKGTAGRCRHGSAHGRVHRYRGHAVRKNVKATHRGNTRLVGGANPWPTMFELAAQERGERSEIFPDWVYPGSALIQRLVPLLPMSRGTQHYRRLIKTLGAYRLTLGQPLQEELIAYAGEGADLALDLAP